MAAGIPVISSDFPLWRKIVDEARCGLLVDPEDAPAMTAAMQWVLDNPEEAQAMGERGRQAIERTCNWEIEAEALIAFYQDKLGAKALPA